MDPKVILGLAGVIFSLLVQFAVWREWRFADWFDRLPDGQQKLFMLAVGLVVVYAAFGLGCFALIAAYWPCTWTGSFVALQAWLAFVLANQTTYALLLKKDK